MTTKRILIIEDDQSIAELQKDYLEIEGYETDLVSDGRKGALLIKENKYDLVLIDIMLPGADGFEILKQIRDIVDIPLLLVSARKEDTDKIRGLGLGADDYITKPFSPGELIARVRAHITRYERMKNRYKRDDMSSVIFIRGLEVQKDARRVFVDGKETALTQKEYDLLLFLIQNPNRVFGKEELFEKIWGYDSLGDATTVTVHIARLREKIESDIKGSKYIETVWGAGYRFKA